MAAEMDYAAFGKAKGSIVMPKNPITVQIVDITGPSDFVLWDGVRDLAAKFIPSNKSHIPIGGLKWAVIRVTEHKSFGLKYTVKQFEAVEPASHYSSRITLSEPDANSVNTDTTGGPLTVEQLTAKTAQDLELIVMSISKVSSVNTPDKAGNPGGSKSIMRFMLADHTGSVNATAWEGNVHKMDGVETEQMIRITKAFIKQDSTKFQYAATSTYHVTVTAMSEVLIGCFWPPWYELTTLRDGLALKSNFTAVVMVGDVASCVYGVKSRAIQISDHTVENPLTLQIKGNLGYKIDETFMNKIIVVFNMTADGSGGMIAKDNQSYFLQVSDECAQAEDVRLWAKENGFIEPTGSKTQKEDKTAKHQSDSDAESVIVVPRGNGKKAKISAAESTKPTKKASTKTLKKYPSVNASDTDDDTLTTSIKSATRPKLKSQPKKAGGNAHPKRIVLNSSDNEYETLGPTYKPAASRPRRKPYL